MSKYYKPYRKYGKYNPHAADPYRLSRYRIDLFLECPRCFYLDRRLGVDRPPGYPFALNSAVDSLLKKEFDYHRTQESTHPLMKSYGIEAVPFQHAKMDEWRDSYRGGIRYLHPDTNLLITGGIDDLWVNSQNELLIVDYKATAKSGEVNLNADWQISYKRQVEIYQWLFRQNGFSVSDIAYFVYCNGDLEAEAFDAKLEFDIKIIPYKGKADWVEETLFKIHKCFQSKKIPEADKDCDYCRYREAVAKVITKSEEKKIEPSKNKGKNGIKEVQDYSNRDKGIKTEEKQQKRDLTSDKLTQGQLF